MKSNISSKIPSKSYPIHEDNNADIEIDMKKMYSNMKNILNFEPKRIKKLLLYNYINDEINSIVFDCRNDIDINKLDKLINAHPSSRLILVMKKDDSLKKSEQLKSLRENLEKNNEKISGFFQVFNDDFNEFMKEFPFFDDIFQDKNRGKMPICVLSSILYMGSFIISKNKNNIEKLHVKSVISLMSEKDKELEKEFGDNYKNFDFTEKNHDEIDFGEICEWIMELINSKMTPILIYDFVGKGVSASVCAAFLMEYKKWPLDLSIGYMMKLSPQINIQPFLYMQMQRYAEKKKNKQNKS